MSSGLPFVFVVPFVVFVPSGCLDLNGKLAGYLVPSPGWVRISFMQSSRITGGSCTILSTKVIAAVSWISRATAVGLSASINSASFPSFTVAIVLPPT